MLPFPETEAEVTLLGLCCFCGPNWAYTRGGTAADPRRKGKHERDGTSIRCGAGSEGSCRRNMIEMNKNCMRRSKAVTRR